MSVFFPHTNGVHILNESSKSLSPSVDLAQTFFAEHLSELHPGLLVFWMWKKNPFRNFCVTPQYDSMIV